MSVVCEQETKIDTLRDTDDYEGFGQDVLGDEGSYLDDSGNPMDASGQDDFKQTEMDYDEENTLDIADTGGEEATTEADLPQAQVKLSEVHLMALSNYLRMNAQEEARRKQRADRRRRRSQRAQARRPGAATSSLLRLGQHAPSQQSGMIQSDSDGSLSSGSEDEGQHGMGGGPPSSHSQQALLESTPQMDLALDLMYRAIEVARGSGVGAAERVMNYQRKRQQSQGGLLRSSLRFQSPVPPEPRPADTGEVAARRDRRRAGSTASMECEAAAAAAAAASAALSKSDGASEASSSSSLSSSAGLQHASPQGDSGGVRCSSGVQTVLSSSPVSVPSPGPALGPLSSGVEQRGKESASQQQSSVSAREQQQGDTASDSPGTDGKDDRQTALAAAAAARDALAALAKSHGVSTQDEPSMSSMSEASSGSGIGRNGSGGSSSGTVSGSSTGVKAISVAMDSGDGDGYARGCSNGGQEAASGDVNSAASRRVHVDQTDGEEEEEEEDDGLLPPLLGFGQAMMSDGVDDSDGQPLGGGGELAFSSSASSSSFASSGTAAVAASAGSPAGALSPPRPPGRAMMPSASRENQSCTQPASTQRTPPRSTMPPQILGSPMDRNGSSSGNDASPPLGAGGESPSSSAGSRGSEERAGRDAEDVAALGTGFSSPLASVRSRGGPAAPPQSAPSRLHRLTGAMSPLRSDPETEDLLAPLEIGGMLAARAASFAQRAASFNYRARLVASLRGRSKQSGRRVVRLLLADAMKASEGLGPLALAARTALTLTQRVSAGEGLGTSAGAIGGASRAERDGLSSPGSVSSRRSNRSDVTSPSRARLVSLLATPPRVSARVMPRGGGEFGGAGSNYGRKGLAGAGGGGFAGHLGLGIGVGGGGGGDVGSSTGSAGLRGSGRVQVGQMGGESVLLEGRLGARGVGRAIRGRRGGRVGGGQSEMQLRRSPRLRFRTARSKAQAMAARRKAEADARQQARAAEDGPMRKRGRGRSATRRPPRRVQPTPSAAAAVRRQPGQLAASEADGTEESVVSPVATISEQTAAHPKAAPASPPRRQAGRSPPMHRSSRGSADMEGDDGPPSASRSTASLLSPPQDRLRAVGLPPAVVPFELPASAERMGAAVESSTEPMSGDAVRADSDDNAPSAPVASVIAGENSSRSSDGGAAPSSLLPEASSSSSSSSQVASSSSSLPIQGVAFGGAANSTAVDAPVQAQVLERGLAARAGGGSTTKAGVSRTLLARSPEGAVARRIQRALLSDASRGQRGRIAVESVLRREEAKAQAKALQDGQQTPGASSGAGAGSSAGAEPALVGAAATVSNSLLRLGGIPAAKGGGSDGAQGGRAAGHGAGRRRAQPRSLVPRARAQSSRSQRMLQAGRALGAKRGRAASPPKRKVEKRARLS